MSDENRKLRRVVRPRFERRYEEDRAASALAGKLVQRPLDVIELTVIGDGRNTAVLPIEIWLRECRELVGKGEMPRDWLTAYEAAYERFLNGAKQDEIVDGTPLTEWAQIGAAQIDICLSRGVRTVEELAGIDEAARKFFGPGFIGLQNKAKVWLSSSNALARENAELKARLEALEARVPVSQEIAELLG